MGPQPENQKAVTVKFYSVSGEGNEVVFLEM